MGKEEGSQAEDTVSMLHQTTCPWRSFLAKFAQKIDDVMPAKPMFMLDDLGVAHVDFRA